MYVNAHVESKRDVWDRMLDKRIITPSGCWEFTGARTMHGYGRISWRNHVERTHRISAHLFLGLDLDDSDTWALHRCDNPPCFHPRHLFLGDAAANVYDAIAKGRLYMAGSPKAERCWRGHDLAVEGARHPSGGCRLCSRIKATERRDRERPSRLPAPESRTHCPRGHEYAGDNLLIWKGQRRCRECKRLHNQKQKGTYVCPTCGQERDKTSRARHLRWCERRTIRIDLAVLGIDNEGGPDEKR